MSELSAQHAQVFVHSVLLAMLKNECRTTAAVIAAVPNAGLDYRPDPSAMTANALLRHIATADILFLKAAADGAFAAEGVKIPEQIEAPKAVAEWYANEHAKNVEALSQLSGEALVKPINFHGMFERPAFAFLQIGLSHAIHHRGQLSTYLRPMGGKVPAIYGESYDSKEAKKAAQPVA